MLEIPNWVPPSVAVVAREMHGSLGAGVPQFKAYADAIERLACDSRMRWVWRELTKTHRSGPARRSYVYPAVAEAVCSNPLFRERPTAAENSPSHVRIQNQAFVILFVELARLRSGGVSRMGSSVRTKKEAKQEIAELRSAAARIRVEAEKIRGLGLGYFSPSLENVADKCLALAAVRQIHNSQDVLIVARNRSRVGDRVERGFIISAGRILELHFGQKMQGLVAVLANVALGRNDITESKVNGMFRSRE